MSSGARPLLPANIILQVLREEPDRYALPRICTHRCANRGSIRHGDLQSQPSKAFMKSGQLDKELNVAQAIEPNDDRAPQVPGLKGRKFRSVIWEWGQSPDLVLELRGYHEQPFCAPRWHVIGNDSYGRSPGMECLAASKMLQTLEKRTAQAIDKVLNPPMVADVSMKNEPASLLPGGVTYVANMAQSGFKPAYRGAAGYPGRGGKDREGRGKDQSDIFCRSFPDDKPT